MEKGGNAESASVAKATAYPAPALDKLSLSLYNLDYSMPVDESNGGCYENL
jgi:hypothetical protein